MLYGWLRNRNTVEFLGVWELINNPAFKPLEFERFKGRAGLNSFSLSPSKWVEATGAIGLFAKAVLSIHANADKLRNVRERIEAGEFPNFSRYAAGFHFATVHDLAERGLEGAFYGIPTKQVSGIFNK